jgi:hypothetical protein
MAVPAFNANLAGFRQVLGDFTRQYMFRLSIPRWLDGDNDGKVLTMFSRTTNLPDFELDGVEIGFQGLKLKAATTAKFSDWSVNVLADENQLLRGSILTWGSQVYDAGTMVGDTFANYKSDELIAEQLNRAGDTIMTYKFYGAYPQKVSSPKFNHDDLTVATFDVNFRYDFFTVGNETAREVGADNEKTNINVNSGNPAANVNNS